MVPRESDGGQSSSMRLRERQISVSGSEREADGGQGSSVRGGKSGSVREADGGH